MKKVLRKFISLALVFAVCVLMIFTTACGDRPKECEHDWVKGTEKAATCTENGSVEYTCSLCGKTKTYGIPALGHEMPKQGTITEGPSCDHMGTMTYTCSVCGDSITEPIAKTDHVYDQTDITVQPGCFTPGTRTISCSVCGDSYTETLDPVGHKDDDYDGYCDAEGDGHQVFIGEVSYPADTISFVGGPWVNPASFSWWSYGLQKGPAEEPNVISISDEQKHTEGHSIKVDFNNGSKCTPENPGGAYVIHLGMDNLIHRANYTLTFWAYASEDFTGNLNKMLDNDNYGPGTSMEAINYETKYSAEELAGQGWKEVKVTFVANPSLQYEERCAFRIAFDVGTEGFAGTLYLADFKVAITDYLRVQEGLPPLSEPTKPVNTTPVLDEIPENALALPYSIAEGAVWTPGPLTFGQGIVSIDDQVEYAKGGRSILINTNKALAVGVESGFILPIPDLEEGKRYQMKFYAQGSETYNGALTNIFANPNYTHQTDGGEVPTMLDIIANVNILTTPEAMLGQDWQEVSLTFTAHPRDGLCSMRVQMTQQNGYKGQLWLSNFVVDDAPIEVKDTPEVSEPVLQEVPQNAITLPETFEASAPWLAGPGYFGDAVVTVDNEVEYAKGGKSLKCDFGKASTSEVAFFIAMSDLEEGQKYTLTFYAQGSTNFNGALNNILANPNYSHQVEGGPEVPTMLELTFENKDPIMTAGGLSGKGWVEVKVNFTAHPKDGKCSLRFQFTNNSGWVGSMWLSNFVVEEAAEEVVDKPTDSQYVLDSIPEHAVALPDTFDQAAPWTSGPGYWGDAVVTVDKEVEYAKGGKSLKCDFGKASTSEVAFFIAMSDLVEDQKYTLTFYVQGSDNFDGALSNILANPNYTHSIDGGGEEPTMLELSFENSDKVVTAGALKGQGWTEIKVHFTAHPKDGKCSLRFQFTNNSGWVGSMWLSNFVVEQDA